MNSWKSIACAAIPKGCGVLFRTQATKVAFVRVAEGFSPAGGSVGALQIRRAAPRGHPPVSSSTKPRLRRLNTSRKHTSHPYQKFYWTFLREYGILSKHMDPRTLFVSHFNIAEE